MARWRWRHDKFHHTSPSLPNDDRPKSLPAGTIKTILEDYMFDDLSSVAMTFGFVIAAALYVMTYLSFVRLLRYPELALSLLGDITHNGWAGSRHGNLCVFVD